MNIIEYIQVLFSIVGRSLSLDPSMFQAAFEYTGEVRWLLFWVVFIGGLSREIGQSVVLFANRVKPGRFVISLALGALEFLLRVVIVITVVWAMANLLLSEETWPYAQVARGIGLAAAPYWLSFLVLIPYAGLIIERLIQGYVFICLVVALQAVFGIEFLGAAATGIIAILVAQGLMMLLSRLLTPLSAYLNRFIAGKDEFSTSREIYEMFARRNQIVR